MSKKVPWIIFSHNFLRPIRVGSIIGLVLAAACTLGAGEAAAQYCADGRTIINVQGIGSGELRPSQFPRLEVATDQIYCDYSHINENKDRVVFVRNPRIVTQDSDDLGVGIYAVYGNRNALNKGGLSVYVHGLVLIPDPMSVPDPVTGKRRHIEVDSHPHPLDYGKFAVRTIQDPEYAPAGERAHGVYAGHVGEGRVGIDFRNLSLSTTGNYAYGIFAQQHGYASTFENGMARYKRGAVVINVIETERDRGSRVRPLIATEGNYADVIRAEYTRGVGSLGDITVTVEGYTIASGGGIVPFDRDIPRIDESIYLDLWPEGTVVFDPEDAVRSPVFLVGVSGLDARGIYAVHEGRGDIRIRTTDSVIMTFGENSQGIYGTHTGRKLTLLAQGGGTEVTEAGGEVSISVTGGRIVTRGEDSHGVLGLHRGDGGVDVDLTDAYVRTEGHHARGVFGWIRPCLGVAVNTNCDLYPDNEPVEGSGVGDIAIDVTGGSIATAGRAAYAVQGRHDNEGDIAITLTGGATAATRGDGAHGVFAEHRGTTGNVDVTVGQGSTIRTGVRSIRLTGGATTTTREGDGAHGVFAEHRGTTGNVAVTIGRDSTIRTGVDSIRLADGDTAATGGDGSHGVFAEHRGTTGNVAVTVGQGSTIGTRGNRAYGVFASRADDADGADGTGDVTVMLDAASVVTEGSGATGLLASRAVGRGSVAVTVGTGSTIEMMGGNAIGVSGRHTGTGDLAIDVRGSAVTAPGTDAIGVSVSHGGSGNVDVDVSDSSIATTGTGVLGTHTGTGDLAIDVQGGSITTTATNANTQYAHGVFGIHSGSGTLDINVQGADITTSGARGGDGIRARISNEDDVAVAVTVGQGSSVRGTRFGVRVFIEGTEGTTGGTGAGVRSGGLGAVMAAGMDRAVPSAHGGRHFQVINEGSIRGDDVGVRLEPGGSVQNRGRIEGKIGIQAGGGSRVENSGTILSTDGADGTSIHFDPGDNELVLLPGSQIKGDRVQGVCGKGDTLNFEGVSPAEIGSLICVNDDGTPGEEFTVIGPRLGKGRLIRIGETLYSMDTTAFALTDDMLSDLTGSIHAAVIGSGLQAHAGEGDPARNRVWAAPFGGAREQNGPGWLEDGTHYFGGGMLGAGWGTSTRVGLFVGGSVGQLDVRRMMGSRRTIDMQTVFGGVYARQDLGDWLLDARVLMGRMDHDSTRRGGRQGAANVEYTSIFLSPEVGVATRVQLMSRLQATPRVRVRYAGLFTEGFRERSVGLTTYDLQFAKRDVHVLEARGEVGIPIALHAGGGRIEPRVGIEGRWLAAGDTIDVTALNGQSRVLDVGGDRIVGTGTVGVGMVLPLPVADSTALVGNFDGAYTTEEAWRATGYLGLVYSF